MDNGAAIDQPRKMRRAAAACLLLAAAAAWPAAQAAQSRPDDEVLPPPLAAANPAAPFYSMLPAEVRKAGVLRFVGDSHPPYRIVSDDRRIRAGLDPELAHALSQVLGIPIHHHVVNSLSGILAGIEAGRYDVTMGPALATPDRLLRFDAVSWIVTRPSFVYPTSRAPRYQRVEDLCGRRISYVAGSVTERVIGRVNERCGRASLAGAVHVPLVDTNMTLIATQAGRADLAGMTLTAALHTEHVNGERFRVFTDPTDALGVDVLSLFVTKRSGLGPALLAAMQAVFDNGQYERIMTRWGVTAVHVQAPQMNTAKLKPAPEKTP